MADELDRASDRVATLANELEEHQRQFDALQTQTLALILQLQRGVITPESYNQQVAVIRSVAIAMGARLNTSANELRQAKQVLRQVTESCQ